MDRKESIKSKLGVNCSSADMQQLVNWGYSITAWAQWQQTMLTSYKSAFAAAGLSSIPLIYALGDNDTDPATKQTVSHDDIGTRYLPATGSITMGHSFRRAKMGSRCQYTLQLLHQAADRPDHWQWNEPDQLHGRAGTKCN